MQIANQSVPFGPLSGSGPQTQKVTVTMPAPVTQATAILTGFIAEYSRATTIISATSTCS
jgi:hypothetical protein